MHDSFKNIQKHKFLKKFNKTYKNMKLVFFSFIDQFLDRNNMMVSNKTKIK